MAERTYGAFARRFLERRLARLVRDGRRAVGAGDEDALHALRIDIKRLRYALEFAAPLLAGDARDALALLALAQERLGALADADMFARTYERLRRGAGDDGALEPGLRRLHDDACRDRHAALADIRTLWDGDESGSYPERLAASISAALGSLSNDEAS